MVEKRSHSQKPKKPAEVPIALPPKKKSSSSRKNSIDAAERFELPQIVSFSKPRSLWMIVRRRDGDFHHRRRAVREGACQNFTFQKGRPLAAVLRLQQREEHLHWQPRRNPGNHYSHNPPECAQVVGGDPNSRWRYVRLVVELKRHPRLPETLNQKDLSGYDKDLVPESAPCLGERVHETRAGGKGIPRDHHPDVPTQLARKRALRLHNSPLEARRGGRAI